MPLYHAVVMATTKSALNAAGECIIGRHNGSDTATLEPDLPLYTCRTDTIGEMAGRPCVQVHCLVETEAIRLAVDKIINCLQPMYILEIEEYATALTDRQEIVEEFYARVEAAEPGSIHPK